MNNKPGHDITIMLGRISSGDQRASEELLPLVYAELRRLAHARMAREKPGQTLQATGLVHEAYLRLIGNEDPSWDGRGHFFAAAAESMRRILIERARRKSRQRHGGELHRATFETGLLGVEDGDERLLDLDRALTNLEERDSQMASIVKLRFFAGLSIDETAAALAISPRTVNRSWLAARAWLHAAIDSSPKTRDE